MWVLRRQCMMPFYYSFRKCRMRIVIALFHHTRLLSIHVATRRQRDCRRCSNSAAGCISQQRGSPDSRRIGRTCNNSFTGSCPRAACNGTDGNYPANFRGSTSPPTSTSARGATPSPTPREAAIGGGGSPSRS